MIARFLPSLLLLALVAGCFTDSRRRDTRAPGGFDSGPGFDVGPAPDVGPRPDAGFSSCGDAQITGNEVCDGEAGCAPDCLSITFTGVISSTDPTWSRNSSTCSAGSSSAYHYDAQGFTWRGSISTTLTFTAAWASFDGYLHAFDRSFNPTSPTLGCVAGDDDTGGTRGSAVSVEVNPGDDLDIVLSTFSAGSTGDWGLTVTQDN